MMEIMTKDQIEQQAACGHARNYEKIPLGKKEKMGDRQEIKDKISLASIMTDDNRFRPTYILP